MALELTAAPDDDGRRLDRILRKALRDLPLSAIHRLLRLGFVLVNGEKAGAERRVCSGETITVKELVQISTLQRHKGAKENEIPEMNPEIIYEGSGLLILNKPAGLAVHGKGSLEDRVRSYLAPKLPPSLSFRPGPLHRLDKPSSGVIAFSASLEGARVFSELMRSRRIKKSYLAVVEGAVKGVEIWKDELVRDQDKKKTLIAQPESGAEAKAACTRVRALATSPSYTLILAEIETGRTHQIRAQAASHGHPLLADRKYGGHGFPGSKDVHGFPGNREAHDFTGAGFLLHAWRMEFPAGLPLPALIEAPLPDYFRCKIRELFGKDFPDEFKIS